MRRRWLRVCGLGIALVGAACTRAPAPASSAADAPDIALERVTVRNFRGSKLQLVAKAPQVDVLRSTMDLWAAEPRVTVPGAALIQAAKASGNIRSGHLEGSGGVTLITPDGINATSPSVTYEGAERGASSDAGVRITHPRFTLDAEAFAVDFASQHAEFSKPVTLARPSP